MMDLLLLIAWSFATMTFLIGAMLLRRNRLSSNTLRHIFHIAASAWVLGWPFWTNRIFPVGFAVVSGLVLALLPFITTKISSAFSGGEDTWMGIVLYAFSYVLFTIFAFFDLTVPAASALLALSWGDGIGGWIGSRWGRTKYDLPWAKTKSLEGSFVVGLGASAGILASGVLFNAPFPPLTTLIIGATASVSEALSPRSMDNLFVPLVVWSLLRTGAL